MHLAKSTVSWGILLVNFTGCIHFGCVGSAEGLQCIRKYIASLGLYIQRKASPSQDYIEETLLYEEYLFENHNFDNVL